MQPKPKEEKIDHYRPQGEEFDKAYTYDYTSRIDDTTTSMKKVTSEKITVSDTDRPLFEETEKPRYPKHLDVGRIVIEEISEDKKKVTERDGFKRDEVKPRDDKEIKKLYPVRKDLKPQVKQDVIEVGRLNMTDYEKTQHEPERITVEKDRKVTTNRLLTLKAFRNINCKYNMVMNSSLKGKLIFHFRLS